jgi:hypothetical protein
MALLAFSKPRLRDVECRAPTLETSKSIVFFAPHSNERQATLPLISRVGDALWQEGLDTSTVTIEDMADRVSSYAVRLHRLGLSRSEKEKVNRLFYLKDACIRLDLLTKILAEFPDSKIAEMHALDRDYQPGDRFEMAPWFYRIPDTRVLYLRDIARDYAAAIERGLEVLDNSPSEKIAKAAALLEIDLAAVRASCGGMATALRSQMQRTILIETPAPAHSLDVFESATEFEKRYAFSANGMCTLSDSEISALIMALANAPSPHPVPGA